MHERVLPDTGANWIDAAFDVLMFLMPGGAERTEAQWTALLGSVGLKIVKIWMGPPTNESIVEVDFADV